MTDFTISLNVASLAESLRNTCLWYHDGVLPADREPNSRCLDDVAVVGTLFGEVDKDAVRILHCFFAIDASTERFAEIVREMSDALPANVVFVGTLVVTSDSDASSEIDDDVIADLTAEAGVVVQISADECAIRSGSLADMQGVVVKSGEQGAQRSATLLDQSNQDYGNGRVSLSVCLPITISFLLYTIDDLDLKIIEQIDEWTERVKRLHFLSENGTTMISANGDVCGNLADDASVIDLYRSSQADPDSVPKNKNLNCYADRLVLSPIERLCAADSDSQDPPSVPMIQTKNGDYKHFRIVFVINGTTVVKQNSKLTDAAPLLVRSLLRELSSASRMFLQYSSFSSVELNNFNLPQGYLFLPDKSPSYLSLYYPATIDSKTADRMRQRLHKLFNLPFGRPALRTSMRHQFPTERSFLLRDVHLNVSTSNSVGSVTTVQGHYNYHHYMQDGIDDNGWGCAYRSFQTVWSWFMLQGYTDKAPPTHREIQQALVDIGDKPASFVGTKQWVGSMELSFCLDHLLGITSRILTAGSGAEMAEKARELALHFATEGTPVMIGEFAR
uniref:Ufm1-specific protease 2 n=1 Tax=Plectus sambesii TaxID=2011161 RepID=A0A914WJF0_9BILA